jgi:hypothetical protein
MPSSIQEDCQVKRFSLLLAVFTMLAVTPAHVVLAQAVKAKSTRPPTETEIYQAKAKGMVWTNSVTKVYHKDGEFYGRTRDGEFMTEADAIKKYYRPAPASKPTTPRAASTTKK